MEVAEAGGEVVYTTGYDTMITWVRERINIPGYKDSMWGEEHDATVTDFLSHPNTRRMLAHVKNDELFLHTLNVPPGKLNTFMYFIREESTEVSHDNIQHVIQFGVVNSDAMDSLLRVMSSVYAPQILNKKNWPESVKKDFTGQLHKFMASLTETSNQAQGKTVLYLPSENIGSVEEAAKDKDLVQRLESTVIHWTRQIKEVVTNQDNAHNGETSGPLEEIKFWRSRTLDLSGISEQLHRPGVRRIVAVLETAKSSYLGPFETLSNMIQDGSIEANDNLRFLNLLTEPCEALAQASPKDIPSILPNLLNCIRIIWSISRYYNTEERLTGLQRKVSNEIINRCCAQISLKDIFDGDVEGSMVDLEESIKCGEAWKACYRTTADAIAACTPDRERHWNFDDASIFAQIDAFVQRCRDLLEVCEGQIQFARKSRRGAIDAASAAAGEAGGGVGGGDRGFATSMVTGTMVATSGVDAGGGTAATGLPAFGGSRGPEITKALLDIEAAFEGHIERLRQLNYEVLDVKASRWHDDFNFFKNGVKDLEVMMVNVINTAFESVARVADGVALLEAFYFLAKRDAIQRCVEKKTADVYTLFIAQVAAIRTEFDTWRKNPPLRFQEPQFAGAALWARGLLAVVREGWTLLEDAHYLVHTREADEAAAAYASLVNVLDDFKMQRNQAWMGELAHMDASNLQSRLEAYLMKRNTGDDVPAAVAAGAAGGGAAGGGAGGAGAGGGGAGGAAAGGTTAAMVVAAATAAQHMSVKTEVGHLECNFDQPLLTLFTEVFYWEKFTGEVSIPYVAHDICNQKEKLRVLREHVMLVVRDHNQILMDLSVEERRLFQDHLRRLDKRINQGLSKLTWASKGIVDWYVKDCRKNCEDTHAIVSAFKTGKEVVARNCRTIATTMLIRIEKNYVYDEGVFEAKQAEHRLQVKARLQAAHENIKSTMKEMFQNFKDNSSDVQREWRAFTTQTDRKVEQALRQTVKKSLQELSRAINGDAKTEPQTLFKINVVLENNRVEFRPTMINLTQIVNTVSKELITTISVVPRLKEVLAREAAEEAAAEASAAAGGAGMGGSLATLASATSETTPSGAGAGAGKNTFYDVIASDDDTLKILVQIMNGMSSSATELQKYLSYWDKYRPIWEMDKEAFIRRYAKANRPLVQYDIDITRYKEQQQDIQAEDLSNVINFIRIDCTLLKASLVGHCAQWQNKLTGLLNANALAELQGLHDMFSQNTTRLEKPPLDLTQLSDSLTLLKKLQREAPEVESKFEPLEQMYATLGKFDVVISDHETQMAAGLRGAWEEFQTMMKSAERALEKSKVNMKRDLESALDTFNNHVVESRKEMIAVLPYGSDVSVERAFQLIEETKVKAASTRAREAALKPGLDIFNIDAPNHKEVRDTEKELELLDAIWSLTDEWNKCWNGWKSGTFASLDVEEMENTAAVFFKRIGRLGRDIKKWKVWESVKEKVDQFRQTMPLIQDLKNPAMRPRHWDSLRSEINKQFDPGSPDFTLERVFSLGLHLHAEFIGDMSVNANKELSIEQALVTIAERWSGIDIDVTPYKDSYHKIRSTDDLFMALEDDQVSLSTMKASKFYLSFKDKINYWETTLSHVSEVVELGLAVQRQWMYLESIFMASEDIRKQLPTESGLFQQVNDSYKFMMSRIVTEPNAVRACGQEGMMEMIQGMDSKLEQIQKSLDRYLETKRQIFPRFYFLSNDDLLEILGQSRDPSQVQKHIKKCFEGIKQLLLIAPGKQLNRTYEAAGMVAPDREEVPFVNNVIVDGAVESWLVEVEKTMILTLQKLLALSLQAYRGKKEKWIREWAGQLLITTGQIAWTNDCTRALGEVAKGNKNAMRQLKKKQVSYLNRLTDMVRSQLTKIERSKLVALITMEIHSRDVMERMIKGNASAVTDFDWLSQLRFVFNKDEGQFGICWVKQTNATLEYSYEYQGNNGRLVVTPLTDRCVLTLNTALFLNRGGNPLGPAGTGKTETVKDLGKNLGKYVIVINCSDGLDYKSVGRMFSGLVQCGAWGCFDEFNRIEIEVLSVVAMQILSIFNALSQKLPEFVFMGEPIRCNPNCGIFITMNPGYAGRTELPDNLKALMRPVAMMSPDLALIAEVMLQAEGFREGRSLAKKTVTLYNLMIQQLSKQDHYDYGLRNLKAVLNCAGGLKRSDPDMNEEAILMRALRDMNLPKFIKDDMRLFRLLLGDLFPALELPVSEYGPLHRAIEGELEAAGLQKHPYVLDKAIQLYESKVTRHCNMLVGQTMGGKSTVWRTLAKAKTALSNGTAATAPPGAAPVSAAAAAMADQLAVSFFVLNPKAVTLNELYGAYDLATFEWADGVLSTVFRTCAQNEKQVEKWIMFDGPVDTLWIESMNSTMDDNKVLTLINGDRIMMTPTMSLLFEVQDLSVASPATVSRAGMVYIDVSELGYQPFVESWLDRRWGEGDAEAREFHAGLVEKYVDKLLEHKSLTCVEAVPIVDFNGVESLLHLYDTLTTRDNGVVREDQSSYFSMCEKWFVYSLVWSVCAAVDERGRRNLDVYLRDMEAQFPPLGSVYDYYIDVKKQDWEMWETRVPQWRAQKDMPFHKMIIPTVDTVRNAFVVSTLLKVKKRVLVVGNTGTGKTVLCLNQLELLPDTHSNLVINFSSATKSLTTQEIIESCMEKRSKVKFGPSGGKQLVCFIDDFNMPKKDQFGFQPALELLRQWVDYGGWYDRGKCLWKIILDMQLLCAMAPPSGGRAVISKRTQSRFHLLNFTFPADSQVCRIYESILVPRLSDFDDEIKPLGPPIALASLQVYKDVVEQFLPTPLKSHYLFNLRDVSKVVQGVVQADRAYYDTKDSVLRLWVHECYRVFSDRFLHDKAQDVDRFQILLGEKLSSVFNVDYFNLMTGCEDPIAGPIFVDFLRDQVGERQPPYEEVTDPARLKLFLEEKLEDYNMEPKLLPMNLVLFKDAIRNVCRIHRVLKQPRGNALLVGVGGSGRQSLTRLASFVAEYTVFSIEITKNYRSSEFRDDLRKLYMVAGVEARPTTFLFNDTQIKEESFLEDVNNILSSGTVPNLFGRDELPNIYDGVRSAAKMEGIAETPDQLWNLFIDRVRTNLHCVLAMSPVGDALRNRCRMYPGLVSCSTINWFHEWPGEALQEVGLKFLQDVKLGSEKEHTAVALVFASTHLSVVTASGRMLDELKRHNYVTPTNFLELVKGYIQLLEEKRKEIGDASGKLRNGLAKLEDSRTQVETMSVALEKKKETVAQSQKDCEELLVVIVSERRVADEQRKQVEADSERIGKEEEETRQIADDAEADLKVALPALKKAMEEVDKLDKGSISEVKAYAKPPRQVEQVLAAVMTLFGGGTDWPSAKKKIGEPDFLRQIKTFDKENVSNSTLSKVKKFTNVAEFNAVDVAKVSDAASKLCTWVVAIVVYSNVYRDVAPKRARLKAATDSLRVKQAGLKAATEKLAEVTEKVNKLKTQYDDSVEQKNRLRKEAEELEAKLARAEKLISGLAGEYSRWQASIGVYEASLGNLVGDAMVGAGFLSYAGPFDTVYRAELVKQWLAEVRAQQLPFSEGFNFATFLAKPTDVRDWNIQGLPKDSFSTENGVIVTRGNRWPLMIDPQGQANKWIKAMEGTKLKVIDLKMKDFLRDVENGIQFGSPVLLQDVLEELDPSLEPVLSKSIMKVGNREVIKIGEKELDYSHDFRFYITTKMGNPHYTPEVSTKTTVVNFAVKQQGLEAQLLGIVVQKEKPKLEEQKSELTLQVAGNKRKLVDLENDILRLLSESTGSLLDDEALVATLQQSKVTSEEVTEQLKVAEETEVKIDAAREGYRPAAVRASIIYFMLDDLGRVDPMYQFSLDAYVDLFNSSIDLSRANNGSQDELSERNKAINNYHTYAAYASTCRGLFERHKLLFSFQMCIRILQSENKIMKHEYDFFLLGGIVVDRSELRPNPCADWLDEISWDNVTELDKVPGFLGIASSFEQGPREWKSWYMSSRPEEEPLPADWDNKCNEMQHMCILRSLRPDRVLFAASRFVASNLGPQFADPPPFDLAEIFSSSSPTLPLIFVLSPGVDPTAQVFSLAASMDQRVLNCALGQGQESVAKEMIEDGLAEGHWVFLANCHLMLSWMPALEKIVESLAQIQPHPNFRLWLSSSPHPKFPISILQRGIKMTTEPPRGLKANLLRLYNLVSEEQFSMCAQQFKYKKLLFCLSWFHALLLERRKFKALGWNVPYEFNESDFSICHDLIIVFLDEYPDRTPWDALRYLIAEANYGGRVTDDWDRRLVLVYINQFFCDEALNLHNFPLSELGEYFVPQDGELSSYKAYLKTLPITDHPAAFGQHPNADISSQIEETNELLDTILGLQPKVVVEGAESNESRLLRQAANLEDQVPEVFDLRQIRNLFEGRSDPEPMKTVVFQEVERYNDLLMSLKNSLVALQQSVQGLVVITAELEQISDAVLAGKVPSAWSSAYPSIKPLGSWMRDLGLRCEQMRRWTEEAMPKVFWISGFTYPTGFLTAILQTSARKNGTAIDSLSWEFPVMNQDEGTISQYPKEGAYVKGLFLEGARWDFEHGHLAEPLPMELFCQMPLVHFKPVDNKKKVSKGMYSCPIYMYPVRTGTRERPSFMIAADIKSGSVDADFWTRRGVAMLLSLAI